MKHAFGLSSTVILVALFLNGCAIWQALSAEPTPMATDCETFFEEMDQRVAEHGVGDAGAARIASFPELRVDRFLASFAKENLTDKVYADWLERLRKLDQTGRIIEWRNLPHEAATELQAAFGPNVETTMNVCGQILTEQVLISTTRRAQLLAAIKPPEAYSTWQRVLGLYYLTRWAIVDGVWRVQREMREPFVNPEQMPPATGLSIRYASLTPENLDVTEVAKILEQSESNSLGIPEPSDLQLARLFATFAPTWIVDTNDDNDRIGSVRVDAAGKSQVDTTIPSVYRLPSYTRFGGQVLLQLNYVIWFPARPATSWLDIYAGRFDGLIWRVTLRKDGRPLAYDSIHPCGCYYQIFPGEGLKVAQLQDGSEPILSPMPIPFFNPGERLTLRLSSGNHFILSIQSEHPNSDATAYDWLDYDVLRSLPSPDGQRRSLFDENGLVEDSVRAERFLLWPMGVPSAGAMRQWGTHAIAFLGRRHFDDPRLMEKLLRPLWE